MSRKKQPAGNKFNSEYVLATPNGMKITTIKFSDHSRHNRSEEAAKNRALEDALRKQQRWYDNAPHYVETTTVEEH